MIALGTIYFYICAALALGGALAVVFAKNPIRGAMGLLLLILNVAGLFISLHAQFLAVVQLIVYAGAIVILFLFVIMLLGPSASTARDTRGVIARTFGGVLFGVTGLGALFLVTRAQSQLPSVLPGVQPDAAYGGIDAFGAILFSYALTPFEVSSALLMVAVVGAIAVARGRQGMPSLSKSEKAVAERPAPTPLAVHSGVFSHESAGASSLSATALLEIHAKKEHGA